MDGTEGGTDTELNDRYPLLLDPFLAFLEKRPNLTRTTLPSEVRDTPNVGFNQVSVVFEARSKAPGLSDGRDKSFELL